MISALAIKFPLGYLFYMLQRNLGRFLHGKTEYTEISRMKSETGEDELSPTGSVIDKPLRHMVRVLNIAEHRLGVRSPGFKLHSGTECRG